MLSMKTYTQDYIDQCRSRVDADLSAYRNLAAAARKQPVRDKVLLDSAIEAFEATFFNNMVLILDAFFVHRLRTMEGKDGNPMNEVRVMCNSMLQHDGVMSADNSIRLSPEKSVLKYRVGQEIKVKEADFVALSSAFFAEIENKYL